MSEIIPKWWKGLAKVKVLDPDRIKS